MTLTKLQERIVGTTMSISATEFVWLAAGQVNSLNRLKELDLVGPHCYGRVQRRHLTPDFISIFFSQNDETFAIATSAG
jgi:hypothetical protein